MSSALRHRLQGCDDHRLDFGIVDRARHARTRLVMEAVQPLRDDTDGSCGIAIMAKASAPGRTKTRLVPPLTLEQAAALNTVFLQFRKNSIRGSGEM
jgi:hypothetical protein